jgi:hypothetical protein
MTASEVIGYKSPEYGGAMAAFFAEVYFSICRAIHVNPEREDQMDLRLTEDRLAKGTEERDVPAQPRVMAAAALPIPKNAEWLP